MQSPSWKIRFATFTVLLTATTAAFGEDAPKGDAGRSRRDGQQAGRDDGIRGEVVRSDKQSVTIRTEDGAEKTFKWNDSSLLEIDGRESRFNQLKPGQRLWLNLEGDTIRGAHSLQDDLPLDRGLGRQNEGAAPDRTQSPEANRSNSENPTGRSPIRLGVLLGPSPTIGARIHQVDPNSPAARAGFQAGDFIVRLNGRDITRPEDVGDVLSNANREEELVVSLWRNGQTTENRVSLVDSRTAGFRGDPNAQDPARQGLNSNEANQAAGTQSGRNATNNPRAWLGIAFQDASRQSTENRLEGTEVQDGAQVRNVFPGSPAERAGVRVGDVVRRFNDQEIARGQQVVDAMHQVEPQSEVRLTIVRNGEESEIRVNVEEREQFFRTSRR